MKAVWNDKIIAESNDTVNIEGNHYFPRKDVNMEYLQSSETHTTCPWKGVASYYDVLVDGKVNKDAAWYYPETSDAAKPIENYIAFWHGVEVTS